MSELIGSLLQAAAEHIAQAVPDTSEHKDVISVAAFNRQMRAWGARVSCCDCGSKRTVYFSRGWVSMQMARPIRPWDDPEDAAVEWWIRTLLPGMAPLIEVPCWDPRDKARVAEWLTGAVAAGGPHGRDLRAMIEWGWTEFGADSRHMLWLMEHMGFTPKGAFIPRRIRLPKGHPARTWEEDAPHPGDGTLDEDVLRALR